MGMMGDVMGCARFQRSETSESARARDSKRGAGIRFGKNDNAGIQRDKTRGETGIESGG
jgi:hypothetical protein